VPEGTQELFRLAIAYAVLALFGLIFGFGFYTATATSSASASSRR